MKNQLQNDICLYCSVMSGQLSADMIVALGSTAIVGFVGLLAPSPLNR